MSPKLRLFFVACCVVGNANSTSANEPNEIVTIYPAYGYQDQTRWVVPLRVWVHERRPAAEAAAVEIVARMDGVASEELHNFRDRVIDFLADSESREVVSLTFDHDPLEEQFPLTDSSGRIKRSDLNGLIEGTISLSLERAEVLLKSQQSLNGWLSLSVTSNGHTGVGRIELIAPAGISIISDIDDTIKITEVPAGLEVVARNSLLQDFRAAPEMADRYRGWLDSGASFHYVSGGPWQMYRPVSSFLINDNDGFPEGSFHMKSLQKNLFSTSSWKNLAELASYKEQTIEHKISQITLIMERFPRRQFILVGDSGEKDPEVYRAIQNKFSEQIVEIWIRDIVNDREKNPDRLDGMHVIPASTVEYRASEIELEFRPD